MCYFLPDQEADSVPVVPGVIETAPGRLPVPARSAGLLVVPGHRLGNVPVGDKPVGYKGTSSMRCGRRSEGRSGSEWVQQGSPQQPKVGRRAGRGRGRTRGEAWLGHLQSIRRPPCREAAQFRGHSSKGCKSNTFGKENIPTVRGPVEKNTGLKQIRLGHLRAVQP